MKRLILSLLIVCAAFTNVKANDADTIVAWHTLKATSDYRQQLKELQEGEYLIVWVGYSDLELWEKLHNGNNCYVSALPGVKQGLLIGQGKGGTQLIVEFVTPLDLTNSVTQDRIYNSYVSRPTKTKTLTLEEQLLGSGVQEPDPLVPTSREAAAEQQLLQNLAQKAQPTVNMQVQVPTAPAYRAPIGHTHTCAKGHTWDHVLNPGHNCQKCGLAQYMQDPFPRPVPLR